MPTEENNTGENSNTNGANGSGSNDPPKPVTRRRGRQTGSKNKPAAKKRGRKPREMVFKLADGTELPPPEQLPAAYLFACAAYAHELQSKLPSVL